MSGQLRNIIVERDGPVMVVTLNRPHKLNALSEELLDEFEEASRAAAADTEIRVVLIKGAGRAFSSGYDLTAAPSIMFGRVDPDGMYDLFQHVPGRYFRSIWEVPKAFVAQVHGYCLAGAMDLVSFCDIAIAGESARFGYPPVRQVSIGISSFWPYLIGSKKSKELLFTGNLISAREAYEFGLVNKVVRDEELDAEAMKMARAIAEVPPMSIKYCKRFVNQIYELMGVRTALDYAVHFAVFEHGSMAPEHEKFYRELEAKGLRHAIAEREKGFSVPLK